MGLISGTKKVFKFVFNIQIEKWLDYEYLSSSTQYMVRQLKALSPPKIVNTKSNFKETAEKLGWTTEMLESQCARFLLFSQCFLVFSLFSGIYCVMIGLKGNLMGAIMAFSLMILGLVQAFRYHFWRYSLLSQKLDCTLEEWFRGLFNSYRKNLT